MIQRVWGAPQQVFARQGFVRTKALLANVMRCIYADTACALYALCKSTQTLEQSLVCYTLPGGVYRRLLRAALFDIAVDCTGQKRNEMEKFS